MPVRITRIHSTTWKFTQYVPDLQDRRACTCTCTCRVSIVDRTDGQIEAESTEYSIIPYFCLLPSHHFPNTFRILVIMSATIGDYLKNKSCKQGHFTCVLHSASA